MDRANQNFTPHDIGMLLTGTRSNRGNRQSIYRPFPGASPPVNPREEVVLEPWRMLFPERVISGAVPIPSFREQRWYYPNQMTYPEDHADRYRAAATSFTPEPSPTSSQQGRWVNNAQYTTEDESNLTRDEQNQALNKLKKEVYLPNKTGKRPSLYFREHYSLNRKVGDEGDEDGKRCAVCLDDFEAREVVTVTPCKHMFHEDCIIPWIKSKGRCPVCRYAICERFRENAAAAAAPNNNNNLMGNEPYDAELMSIIRAMEEAYVSENMRRFY